MNETIVRINTHTDGKQGDMASFLEMEEGGVNEFGEYTSNILTRTKSI